MMSRHDARGIDTEFDPGSCDRGLGLRPDDSYFPRRGLPFFATTLPVELK